MVEARAVGACTARAMPTAPTAMTAAITRRARRLLRLLPSPAVRAGLLGDNGLVVTLMAIFLPARLLRSVAHRIAAALQGGARILDPMAEAARIAAAAGITPSPPAS